MRKNIFILSCIFFFGMTAMAQAHPPAKITVEYSKATKILRAVITHPVSNPVTHYIKEVEVMLNNKVIIVHNLSRQDNNTTQTVSYEIPDAKIGDMISVEGECSISGKKTESIAVR
jgi:hypothetical protein